MGSNKKKKSKTSSSFDRTSRSSSTNNNVPSLTDAGSSSSGESSSMMMMMDHYHNNNNNMSNQHSNNTHNDSNTLVDGSSTTSSFRISCKEIILLGLILIVFATLSIFIGIFAGLTISVHYYETQEDRFVTYSRYTDAIRIKEERNLKKAITYIDQDLNAKNINIFEEINMNSNNANFDYTTTNTVGEYYVSVNGITNANNNDNDTNNDNNNEMIWLRPPEMIEFDEFQGTRPKLCSDGVTIGYDSWVKLRAAIRYANRYSAERYKRWLYYFTTVDRHNRKKNNNNNNNNNLDRTKSTSNHNSIISSSSSFQPPYVFDDDSLYYEHDVIFTICPGTQIRARRGPMFINTESLILQCNDCTIYSGSSHLSFGPDARNVRVKGITFKHAKATSLLFHYNGAEASFEDCTWITNNRRSNVGGFTGGPGNSLGRYSFAQGTVADVNSTSTVNFFRCYVNKPTNKREALTSSLTIRHA